MIVDVPYCEAKPHYEIVWEEVVDLQGLAKFLVTRLIITIPYIFVMILLVFVLIHATPGDPAVLLAGGTATKQQVETLRKEFGLDKPLYEQFFIYVENILKGNFGFSFYYMSPVIQVIQSFLPNTLLLIASGLSFAAIGGIVLGVVSAMKPNSLRDRFVGIVSLLGYSIPTFWLAIILILIFSMSLNLLPLGGMTDLRANYSGFPAIVDRIRHLVLPTIAVGTFFMAIISRMTRSSMMETLRQPYILAAKAKGIKQRTVIFRHALKNALLPVITVIGLNLGAMLGGAVLTEMVFSWPGVGRMLVTAILNRDYPLVMGTLIYTSIGVLIINFVVDILYAVIDPRIRYQ